MKHAKTVLLALSLALVMGCEESSVLPKSSGRPYEVVLVGDAGVVREVLETDAEVLPQQEPCFDVSETTEDKLDARIRLARSIVVVKTDTALAETIVRYEKNVYAKPQMMVTVSAPSQRKLLSNKARWASSLLQLLTRHEMNAAIASLSQRPNPAAGKTIGETMGVEMSIPADMQASKSGKDFLWFSNNTVQGMQNICLYSYPLEHNRDFAAMRDSIMQRNIPGETDSMYMQTVGASLKVERLNEKTLRGTIVRGLWEMHGDAMGGPFVAHVVADSARGRMLVAEAFVYAPESAKRNKLRRAEAALYTLKLTKKQEQKIK